MGKFTDLLNRNDKGTSEGDKKKSLLLATNGSRKLQFILERINHNEKAAIRMAVKSDVFNKYLKKKKFSGEKGLHISRKDKALESLKLPRSLIVYNDKENKIHYLVQLKSKVAGGNKAKQPGISVGSGGNRVVKYCFDLETNKIYAVAMDIYQKNQSEADTLAKFDHPNIITSICYARYEHEVESKQRNGGKTIITKQQVTREAIVTPYCDKGNLSAANNITDDQTLIKIAMQLLLAMKYAHDKGMCHNDLKPANIMLTDKHDVRVIDWGSAHKIGVTAVPAVTPAYLPPECMAQYKSHMSQESLALMLAAHNEFKAVDKPWNHPAYDMWALGLIFWSLANRSFTPLGSVSEPPYDIMASDDLNESKLTRYSPLQKILVRLSHAMLRPNREKRLTTTAALAQFTADLKKLANIDTIRNAMPNEMRQELIDLDFTFEETGDSSGAPNVNNAQVSTSSSNKFWNKVKNVTDTVNVFTGGIKTKVGISPVPGYLSVFQGKNDDVKKTALIADAVDGGMFKTPQERKNLVDAVSKFLLTEYKKTTDYNANFMQQLEDSTKLAGQCAGGLAGFFVTTSQDSTDAEGKNSMRFLLDVGQYHVTTKNLTMPANKYKGKPGANNSQAKWRVENAINHFESKAGLAFFENVFDTLQTHKSEVYNQRHPMIDAIMSVFGLRGEVRTKTRQQHIKSLRAKALEALQAELENVKAIGVKPVAQARIDFLKENRSKDVFAFHRKQGFFNRFRKTHSQGEIDKLIKVEQQALQN